MKLKVSCFTAEKLLAEMIENADILYDNFTINGFGDPFAVPTKENRKQREEAGRNY